MQQMRSKCAANAPKVRDSASTTTQHWRFSWLALNLHSRCATTAHMDARLMHGGARLSFQLTDHFLPLLLRRTLHLTSYNLAQLSTWGSAFPSGTCNKFSSSHREHIVLVTLLLVFPRSLENWIQVGLFLDVSGCFWMPKK